MEKKSGFGHAGIGRDSGFHWCCIAYFILREKLIKWFFKGDYELYNAWIDSTYAKIGVDHSNWNHIPCPFHKIASIIGLYEPEYHTCRECGWMQLETKDCIVAEHHDTEVRERIRETLLYFKAEREEQKRTFGYCCYLPPSIWGKIGVEVAKEIGYDK